MYLVVGGGGGRTLERAIYKMGFLRVHNSPKEGPVFSLNTKPVMTFLDPLVVLILNTPFSFRNLGSMPSSGTTSLQV